MLTRLLEPARVRFVAVAVLAVSLILLVVSFVTSERGRTPFGPPLGADFAGFYTAGAVLNLPDPGDRERLYDFRLHDELYHRLLPHLPDEEKLPYVHPPFVAWAFSRLALLPYKPALALWLLISAGLYLGGLFLLDRTLRDWPPGVRVTGPLLALSFEPFVMECWLGGQLSAVGFFCLSLAFFLDRRGRPWAAGLALGLALYKPTLLVLFVPMLVVARRWRTLAGFGVAGAALAGLSVWAAGRRNAEEFVRVLLGFARSTAAEGGAGGGLALQLWKYVDLNSFFRLLLGGPSPWHWPLVVAVAALPLAGLAAAWWRLGRRDEDHARLAWAAAFALTPVLNLYVGVYDAVLAAAGAILTADVVRRRPGGAMVTWLPGLLLVLYVTPWLSQPVARATGVQILTPVLMAAGIYPLVAARRSDRTTEAAG